MTEIRGDFYENKDVNQDHRDALEQTGFWGRQGAGCIMLARTTGRILIAHRSADVLQPDTWGTWGGAIDAQEDPAVALRREVFEETDFQGTMDLIALLVYRQNDFAYHNFLAVVDDEFEPRLNWEHQGHRWCAWGDWPSPLHFGLQTLLEDAASVHRIRSIMGNGQAA